MKYTDLKVGELGESNRPKSKPQPQPPLAHRRAGSNASTIPVYAGEIVSLPASSDSVPEFIDAHTETSYGFNVNHNHFHSKHRWSKMLPGKKKQGNTLADEDYGGFGDEQQGTWQAPGQTQATAWQSASGPQQYDTWGANNTGRGGDNKLTKQMSKSKAKIESALSSISMPAIPKGLPKMGKGGPKGRQELESFNEYGYDRDDTAYGSNQPLHSASSNLPSHDPSLAWGASGARSQPRDMSAQQAATVGSYWASVDGGRAGDASGGTAGGNPDPLQGPSTASQPWIHAGSETNDPWARYRFEGQSAHVAPTISQSYSTPPVSHNYSAPPTSYVSQSTPPVNNSTQKWDPFEQHGQAQNARSNLSPSATSTADPFVALSTKSNHSPTTIGYSPDQHRSWQQSAQPNYHGGNLFEPPQHPKQKTSPKSVVVGAVTDATSAVSTRIGAVGIGKKKDMSLLEDEIDTTKADEWMVSGAVSFDQPPPKQRAFVPTAASALPSATLPHSDVAPTGHSPKARAETSRVASAWAASPSLVDQYTSETGGSNVSPAAGYERDIWSVVGTQEKERGKGLGGSGVLAKLKRSTSKGGMEESPQQLGWGGTEGSGGGTYEDSGVWGERGHSSTKDNTGSSVGKTISGALGKLKRQTSKPTVDPVHLPDSTTYGGGWGSENRRANRTGPYDGAGGNDNDLWQPGSDKNVWGTQQHPDSKGGTWAGVSKAGAGIGSAAAAVGDMASGAMSKIRRSNSKPSDLSSDRGASFTDSDIIDDGLHRSQSDAKLDRRGSWLQRKIGPKTKSTDVWGSGSNPNISRGCDTDDNTTGRRMSDVPESEMYHPRAQGGGEGGKASAIEKAKALMRKTSKSGSKEKVGHGSTNMGGGSDYDNRYANNTTGGSWELEHSREKKKWTVESDEDEYIEEDTPVRPPPPGDQSSQPIGSSISGQPIRTPSRPPPPAIPTDVAPVRPIMASRPGPSSIPSRPPPPSIPTGGSEYDSRLETRPIPPSVPTRPAPPAVTPRRLPPPQY